MKNHLGNSLKLALILVFCSFPRSMVTMPCVHAREDLHDPIKSLVARYRGEVEASKRNILTADMVSQDLNGLFRLIHSCCYRAAINLTTRILSSYGQGPGQGGTVSRHSPVSLKVINTVFHTNAVGNPRN